MIPVSKVAGNQSATDVELGGRILVDGRINDILTPAPPDPCQTPVLLIVSAAGRWFAAGIPKTDD